ncbi:MAG: hypothetical protein LBQ15_02655 [Clostridium sp.]|jgi:hypothetical protein|nr:hypothetical protein [Clostridium sp.]
MTANTYTMSGKDGELFLAVNGFVLAYAEKFAAKLTENLKEISRPLENTALIKFIIYETSFVTDREYRFSPPTLPRTALTKTPATMKTRFLMPCLPAAP